MTNRPCESPESPHDDRGAKTLVMTSVERFLQCSPSFPRENLNNSIKPISTGVEAESAYIYKDGAFSRGLRGLSTSDPRFNSKPFREAVHTCLNYLGLDHTMTEFYRLDSQVNWHALAHNLQGGRYAGPEYDLELIARDFPGKETR